MKFTFPTLAGAVTLTTLLVAALLPGAARGQIYETNLLGGTIGVYSPQGATINAALITGLNQPRSLTLANNTLSVVNGSVVGAYAAATGSVVNAALIPALSGPFGIAVVVPEPGTYALVLLGGAGLLGAVRLSRRA